MQKFIIAAYMVVIMAHPQKSGCTGGPTPSSPSHLEDAITPNPPPSREDSRSSITPNPSPNRKKSPTSNISILYDDSLFVINRNKAKKIADVVKAEVLNVIHLRHGRLYVINSAGYKKLAGVVVNEEAMDVICAVDSIKENEKFDGDKAENLLEIRRYLHEDNMEGMFERADQGVVALLHHTLLLVAMALETLSRIEDRSIDINDLPLRPKMKQLMMEYALESTSFNTSIKNLICLLIVASVEELRGASSYKGPIKIFRKGSAVSDEEVVRSYNGVFLSACCGISRKYLECQRITSVDILSVIKALHAEKLICPKD
ncbi:MAG: hypothetical protein LBB63_02465 [Holosporaceae bacterium]|jgi:hypothetical protein|nr:hypothetical protein [Holosporaceae bacterium]